MTITVVRFFDRARDALLVARELEDSSIARDDISIIANNSEDWYRDNAIGGPGEREGYAFRVHGEGAPYCRLMRRVPPRQRHRVSTKRLSKICGKCSIDCERFLPLSITSMRLAITSLN